MGATLFMLAVWLDILHSTRFSWLLVINQYFHRDLANDFDVLLTDPSASTEAKSFVHGENQCNPLTEYLIIFYSKSNFIDSLASGWGGVHTYLWIPSPWLTFTFEPDKATKYAVFIFRLSDVLSVTCVVYNSFYWTDIMIIDYLVDFSWTI